MRKKSIWVGIEEVTMHMVLIVLVLANTYLTNN